MNKTLLFHVLFFQGFLIYSCQETTRHEKVSPTSTVEKQEEKKLTRARFLFPGMNDRYHAGDTIPVRIKVTDTANVIDSVYLSISNSPTTFTLEQLPYKYTWETDKESLGKKDIKAEVYYKNGKRELTHVTIYLLASKEPRKLSYKVNREFPHDPRAYTQGLVYENSYLYEGTGQWGGASSIRKVELKTGKVLKVHNMKPEFFGEGIALVNNKIYQVTYKAQIGFIYDKETFKQVNQFNYPMREGWGLTFNGEHLIMSDGTENIYFLDTTYFTEVRRVQVYDNDGPVQSLNELEFINDQLFANIYQTDKIVIIDPGTGALLATIDLKDILNKTQYKNIDVLNGIAYDQENNKIFVTGKYWPYLFEVEFN